jgi:hypothetical protein
MSLRQNFTGRLAAAALALAAIAVAARAEDHWTTYQTGVESPSQQAIDLAGTLEARKMEARNVNSATRSDASASGTSYDTLYNDPRVNEIYNEMFQPGNPAAELNTK